jgi:hypothetical protein
MRIQQRDMPPIPPPSTRRLAVATLLAVLVAAILLVTVVLPAEYGIDPAGTGRALGLIDLFAGASSAESKGQATRTVARVEPKIVMPQAAAYMTDAVRFTLHRFEGFEYKYRIEKGGGMVYSWQATGRVKYEFHGEPDGAGIGVADSYEKAENDHASGTFTAPTSGIHGWFWENTGDTELTLTLTSAGFYSAATEFRQKHDPIKHKTRVEEIPHDLTHPSK